MKNSFFAMMSRMKYIERWSLMRNSRQENVSEHSLEVSMIAHGLAVIANRRLDKHVNVERTAMIAMYHDSSEIITGDMPTPIKYANEDIVTAFKQIEHLAANELLELLPSDLREDYRDIFFPGEEDAYVWKLVKAADKLSALMKCIEESQSGNKEFVSAQATIMDELERMELEEVKIFLDTFIPAFYHTLDELRKG
ncbi:5'-deoxynucleotidase [Anaeromicropila herbilytica]|uniref:5'-deoxynucleotidase n=1 Tax=Anaeromicropila herbilytica TaxID=2785025 RepID=A0A7R7EPJ1_9FIRM|nr:5'-deoxynucleotidase [Anaeromicropila herbilytica]BCN32638.1 5'-deoxynucleotidase [Anaeromicropila herbilytica]